MILFISRKIVVMVIVKLVTFMLIIIAYMFLIIGNFIVMTAYNLMGSAFG